jgi:hypothetical protein
VTPPGGSRDDDADDAPRDATRPLSINAPRGAPVPGQGRSGAPGASPDDDADDARAGEPGNDPQLRAMRAVWLAMRDEDPPDRGLADLLAAARHKAEAMQPQPGAWQRLLAALRRPPVLALATVTVLIAGALLIGRRTPHEAAPGLTASHEEAAGPTRPAATGAGSSSGDLGARPEATGTYRIQPSADRGAAVLAPQPAAPPPPPTELPPDHGVRPAAPAQITTPPSPAPAPPQAPRPSPPGDTPRKDDDRATAGAVPATSAPAPPLRENMTQLGAAAAVPGADTTGGNSGRGFAHPPPAEPEAQPPTGAANDGRNDTAGSTANRTANKANHNANHNAPDPVANGVAGPTRRPAAAPPRPDADGDLYQQCEAAAQRGDCAVVRRLVSRIARTDRGYRARVAKDSPVGKCLTE